VSCPQGLGQVAEQCGLGFAKTIFWGKGFGKTSTDLDFASGGGGVWGGILRLLHPFLLAKFGADKKTKIQILFLYCASTILLFFVPDLKESILGIRLGHFR